MTERFRSTCLDIMQHSVSLALKLIKFRDHQFLRVNKFKLIEKSMSIWEYYFAMIEFFRV